jgi:hypothetical protein
MGGADVCAPPADIFGRRIQPHQQRVTKMWLYPGPSDLDRSFNKELSDVEINTRILKVLDLGGKFESWG